MEKRIVAEEMFCCLTLCFGLGKMKRHRPSGHQQRKAKKAREDEDKKLCGSLFKFFERSDSVESSSTVSVTTESESSSRTQEEQSRTAAAECPEELVSSEAAQQESSSSTVSVTTESESSSHIQEEQSRTAAADLNSHLKDIAAWHIPVNKILRTEIVKVGSERFQNRSGPFKPVKRPGSNVKGQDRVFTEDWFYQTLPNGHRTTRSWLTYSITTQKAYCFCCRLFSVNRNENKFVTGFSSWWKLNPKIEEHERSDQHYQNYENWKILRLQLDHSKTLDDKHLAAIKAEKEKWRKILSRVVDVILHLAKQNIAFRGHVEDVTSLNRGNFIETLKLLSHYDPPLQSLFDEQKKADPGRRVLSYLSPMIQNEMIQLLGDTVKSTIIDQIKESKYFGIMFDSTPDVAHVDQMSKILRFVQIKDGKVTVEERFLGFIALSGKTASDMVQDILRSLEDDGLDIMMCRGQGYDNAATMSGIHGGVQAKILDLNAKALFVPCANHSLNLCGVHSFSVNPPSTTFFGALDNIYAFLVGSTHRWEVMKSKMPLVTVKRLSDTRWSSHYEAVKSAKLQFDGLVDVFDALTDNSETIETRTQAGILQKNILTFSFLCFLSLWCSVLKEVNEAQKYLQKPGLSVDNAVMMLSQLTRFLSNRNALIDDALKFAEEKSHEHDIPMERRQRRRKRMAGETAEDAGLSFQEEMRRLMFECIDKFTSELKHRSAALQKIADTFRILQTRVLLRGNDDEIHKGTGKLAEVFDDFCPDEFPEEIQRLRRMIKAAKIPDDEVEKYSALQILQFIVKLDLLDMMPNVVLALRFFLTIGVSVASCERSFSKLKLIKSYLRSTMNQDRLSSLALLSIERDIAAKVDFDEVIQSFAQAKSRKGKF